MNAAQRRPTHELSGSDNKPLDFGNHRIDCLSYISDVLVVLHYTPASVLIFAIFNRGQQTSEVRLQQEDVLHQRVNWKLEERNVCQDRLCSPVLVWLMGIEEAHLIPANEATFPEALVEPCVLAGSRPGDIVFDPFMGSGTVASVAQRLGRRWLGAELNPDYIALQAERTRQPGLLLESA